MATLKESILELLATRPGLTDREITDLLKGRSEPQQPVNQSCRQLAAQGMIDRRQRDDGRIGNYPTGVELPARPRTARRTRSGPAADGANDKLSEDEVKAILETWLQGQGWSVDIAWGHQRGADIEAIRGGERWIIEVKGCGSRQPMRVNYFLAVLGETLQRMDDAQVQYSIALPDMPQFRGLWERLPGLAKQRSGIGALFVGADGHVREERLSKSTEAREWQVVAGLERQFHQKMLEIYKRASKECGYRPTRFLQMLSERHGLETAKSLLRTSQPSEGLSILWEHGRLDLSVEALVCEPSWRELFTRDEIAEAARRLRRLDYLK